MSDDLLTQLRCNAESMAKNVASGIGSEPEHYLTGQAAAEIARLRARPTEEEMAQAICEWDKSDRSESRCHCRTLSMDDPNRCQSVVGITRTVLALFPKVQP